jgi:uncharacterized protein
LRSQPSVEGAPKRSPLRPAAVHARENRDAMLWRVANTQLHLLGSCHFLPEPALFTEHEEQLISNASVIAFETNFVAGQEAKALRFGEGKRLNDAIPADLFRDTEAIWRSLGIPDDLSEMRPWAVAMQVMPRVLERNGLLNRNGVDPQILTKAVLQKKQLFYLEPRGQALAAFDGAPPHEQEVMLARVIQHQEEGIADVKVCVDAWKTRTLGAIEHLRIKDRARMPRMHAALQGARNRLWLPKLVRFARAGKPVLAVVGALHMGGEDGLLALLRRSGFECVLQSAR